LIARVPARVPARICLQEGRPVGVLVPQETKNGQNKEIALVPGLLYFSDVAFYTIVIY
jgi:hypothetical protein